MVVGYHHFRKPPYISCSDYFHLRYMSRSHPGDTGDNGGNVPDFHLDLYPDHEVRLVPGDSYLTKTCSIHVSHEKNPGWLGYLGDYTTQLYRDYNKPL